MRHLSSNRWYRPSAWQGESFLLLTEQEAALIDWKLFATYNGTPVRELTYDKFRIFVFSQNIAKSLPGWDSSYETSTDFLVTKHSLFQVGRFVEKYENATPALVAERGEVGALHFGPYIDVESGRYIATFRVGADYNPRGMVRLDVAAAPDQKLFASKVLTSISGPQKLSFTLDKPSTLEFRVWALGNEKVVFKGFTIERE